jgi:hypothetical protein
MALRAKATTENLPAVLPPDEAIALFEQEAWRLVGISGKQFLAKWDAGEYRDLDDTSGGRDIAYLALLIPFGRRLP